MDYIKYVSQKKPSVKNILFTISKSNAFDLTAESLQIELDQMTVKGIIDQNFNMLSLASNEEEEFILIDSNKNKTGNADLEKPKKRIAYLSLKKYSSYQQNWQEK